MGFMQATNCINILAVVSGVIGLTVLVIVTPFLVTRKITQWALRDRWKTRYVRLSFDVTMIGFYFLILVTLWSYDRHLPAVLADGYAKIYWSHWPQSLTDSENRLEELKMLASFLDNFPTFVILPGCVVVFAGYSVERAKQAKTSASI
jgi:hypothetical protein